MRAVTRPLEGELDLNDVAGGDGYLFVRDGVGVAGRGVAARVPYDEAADVLASIEHDDEVGGAGGPIAIGVLPFLPDAPAELVIPARSCASAPTARAWVTLIDDAERAARRARRPRPAAASYEIRPAVDVAHYLARRRPPRATRCASGDIVKAVIARPITVDVRPPDRRPRRARTAAGELRFELSLLGRRVHRGVTRAARGGRRRRDPVAPARRDGADHRRPRQRRAARRRS